MAAILLFTAVLTIFLGLLLARFGSPRRVAPGEDRRPALPRAALRQLTMELCRAMGLSLRPEIGDDNLLVATRPDPFGDSRYVVVLGPEIADQAAVLAAAETIKGEGASQGMLVSAGEIETAGLAGLDVPLELVDRARLRELVARYLPERLRFLDRHRGFGEEATLDLQPRTT
jgi:hypothetical protein